jgi:hypothetical protein
MSKKDIDFSLNKIDEDLDYAEGHFHELDPEVEKKLFEARQLLKPLESEEDVSQFDLLKKRLDKIQHYRGRKYRIMSQEEKDKFFEQATGISQVDVSQGQLRALSGSGIAVSKGYRSPFKKIKQKINIGEETMEADEDEWV